MPADISSLKAVLVWIVAGGGIFFAGKAFAFIAENVPAWNNLPKYVKVIAPLIVAILLSIGSTWLLQQAQLIDTLQPSWFIIAQTVVAYVASQQGYLEWKQKPVTPVQPEVLPKPE